MVPGRCRGWGMDLDPVLTNFLIRTSTAGNSDDDGEGDYDGE